MAKELDLSAFTDGNPSSQGENSAGLDLSAFDSDGGRNAGAGKVIDLSAFDGGVQPSRTNRPDSGLDLSAFKDSKQPADEPTTDDDSTGFSFRDLATGIAIEGGGGIASNVAGAALATALAPVTGGASLLVYGGVSFLGGFLSSYAAQRATGDGRFRLGSALVSGAINTILPGGGAAGSRAAATGAKTASMSLGRALRREAVRGASFASADAAAVAVIDEGRAPTMSELVSSGAVGAGVGTGIGLVANKFVKSYTKIAGKTANEIDDAVSKGAVTVDDVVNITTGGSGDVPPPMRVEMSSDLLRSADQNDVKRAVEAAVAPNALDRPSILGKAFSWVAPTRAIPREVTESIRSVNHRTNASKGMASRLNRAITDFHKGDETLIAKINSFIDGGPLDPALEPIRHEAELYRKTLAELQERLIPQLNELDVRNLSSEARESLMNQIQASIDEASYANRRYRLFDDSKYKFSDKDKALAIEEIAQSMVFQDEMARNSASTAAAKRAAKVRTMNEARKDATEHVQKLISQSRREQEIHGVTRGRVADENAILKQRTNPGPAERKFLGEITDPGERMMNTLSRVASLVERNEANKLIRQSLVESGLASTSHSSRHSSQLKLVGEGDTGLWTDPTVARAINTLYTNPDFEATYKDGVRRTIVDAWSALSSASKGVKVVLNTPAYAANLVSGMFLAANQGVSFLTPRTIARNIANFWEGAKVSATDLKSVENFLAKNPAKRAELIQKSHEMNSYGIGDATVVVEDIRSATRFGGKTSKAFGRAIEGPATVYSGIDTGIRYMIWKHNQELVNSITEGALGGEAVKRLAAELTNNHYNNYSYVNSNVRWASSRGGLNPFVAFMAETTRNMMLQARDASQMYRGKYFASRGIQLSKEGLLREQNEGKRRLAYFVGVMVAGTAGLSAFNAMSGIDSNKEKAIRELLIPDWDKDQPISLKLSDDGKHLSYANASYIMPQLIYAQAIKYALRDMDLEQAATMLGGQFFGDPHVLITPVTQAMTNVDSRGNPISRSRSTIQNLGERAGYVVNEAFTPGVLREANRAIQATEGRGNYTVGDVMLRQVGARVNRIDIAESAMFTIRGELEDVRAYASAYRRARDHRGVSQGELSRIYATENQNYRSGMERMIRHNRSMDMLGMDENQRIDVFKRAGMSSEDILNVLDGRVVDMPREARVTTSSIYDSLPSDEGQRRKAIQEIARKNSKLGRDLVRMDARMKKDSRLGITSRESLIKNLSVASRARMILDSDDPRGMLREWQRRGLASTAVTREVLDGLRSQPASR